MTSMAMSYNQSNLIIYNLIIAICYILPVILLVVLLFIVCYKLQRNPWDTRPSTATSLLDSKDDNQDAINEVNV